MTGRLEGRSVLVTGGASGLGAAMAGRFAAEGALVTIADLDGEGAARLAGGIGGAASLRADVADPDGVRAAVARAVEHGGRLDVLVNNAGIGGRPGPLHETRDEDWRRVMAVDLDGVFYGVKHGVAAMLAQEPRGGGEGSGGGGGRGVVLNVASVAGLMAAEDLNAYAVAKAGVIHLTRLAAVQYGRHGVRTHAICPSWAMTPMVEGYLGLQPDPERALRALERAAPLGRLATPADVAETALWLASDAAGFLNGAVVPVDGGMSAR